MRGSVMKIGTPRRKTNVWTWRRREVIELIFLIRSDQRHYLPLQGTLREVLPVPDDPPAEEPHQPQPQPQPGHGPPLLGPTDGHQQGAEEEDEAGHGRHVESCLLSGGHQQHPWEGAQSYGEDDPHVENVTVKSVEMLEVVKVVTSYLSITASISWQQPLLSSLSSYSPSLASMSFSLNRPLICKSETLSNNARVSSLTWVQLLTPREVCHTRHRSLVQLPGQAFYSGLRGWWSGVRIFENWWHFTDMEMLRSHLSLHWV